VVVEPADAVLGVAGDRPLTGGPETVVGGMQVQCASQIQWRRLPFGFDGNALYPFADAIGGQLRRQVEVGAGRDRGIGAVHRCFV
jgi:hypothetical protein